jgi:hypothetical protein
MVRKRGAGKHDAMNAADLIAPDERADELRGAARRLPPRLSAEARARPQRPAHSGRVLFRVPFHSLTSDADAARLRGALDMALALQPKHPAVRPPLGVARLDWSRP